MTWDYTPAPKFKDTPKYQQGHRGEVFVAQLLKGAGWYIIPSYDYSGQDGDKAPRLSAPDGTGLVIPDLDIAKDGRRKWAEVKVKGHADLGRISGKLEHGIPRRHLDHYRDVQKITGCEVWLFIVEEDTGDVYCQHIDKLTPRYSQHPSMGRMAYFVRDEFVLLKRAAFKVAA